jgi:hypothetical protein
MWLNEVVFEMSQIRTGHKLAAGLNSFFARKDRVRFFHNFAARHGMIVVNSLSWQSEKFVVYETGYPIAGQLYRSANQRAAKCLRTKLF